MLRSGRKSKRKKRQEVNIEFREKRGSREWRVAEAAAAAARVLLRPTRSE